MRVVDYKQTKSKQEAVAFIETTKDDSVYEITVHGEELDFSKLRSVKVYVNGEAVYSLIPAEGKYWCKELGEFYLSKTEGWQLCKFFESCAEGGVTPHWWPYAERNIRRHKDPLKELRVAMLQGLSVEIKFGE